MISQIHIHEQPGSIQPAFLSRCLVWANWAMIINLSLTVLCLVISYGYAEFFSLYSQIAAHLLTIVFAGVFKLAYVLRCFALYNLGSREF
ncbi:hypothetical protein PULV_a3756 [Pseudoalteromonas ulvae UL12]|uniref:Uncharacterized protein n=1 Tax=Pseudoalteromonas ulvae TaxID=107327 RepID=A0A244CKX6_PSEDV|nr:hypothetical protein [Pseudoalteromonas ulvae]MBE0362067.1 hypothetical protein [Pseudoalteromonas ulvae UL12]OUL55952.1 hypothetical protein B1199_19800 [Pseudoalteromonas ulvae]